MDNEVAALADTVFKTYNDVESMANALNYYKNKTGWAYLVYQWNTGFREYRLYLNRTRSIVTRILGNRNSSH
ncbi:hypothetical protein ANCDUO_23287 [Ancylostoma duodenale]|uniref:Uncharacterized protein n=1 Tax=Ancylostoma duodenale TaxID=51022 RepID=A0A0C2FIU4_9BILA|nr:hypothetical protein ANCDUO_23287 [Ancylostoma duodenale]